MMLFRKSSSKKSLSFENELKNSLFPIIRKAVSREQNQDTVLDKSLEDIRTRFFLTYETSQEIEVLTQCFLPLWEHLILLLKNKLISVSIVTTLLQVIQRPELSIDFLISLSELFPEIAHDVRSKVKKFLIQTLHHTVVLYNESLVEEQLILDLRKQLTKEAILSIDKYQCEQASKLAAHLQERKKTSDKEPIDGKEVVENKNDNLNEEIERSLETKCADSSTVPTNSDCASSQPSKELKETEKNDLKEETCKQETASKHEKRKKRKHRRNDDSNENMNTEQNENETTCTEKQNNDNEKTSQEELDETTSVSSNITDQSKELEETEPRNLEEKTDKQELTSNQKETDIHDSDKKSFEDVCKSIHDPDQYVFLHQFDEVEQKLSSRTISNINVLSQVGRILAVLSVRMPSCFCNIPVLYKWYLFFHNSDEKFISNLQLEMKSMSTHLSLDSNLQSKTVAVLDLDENTRSSSALPKSSSRSRISRNSARKAQRNSIAIVDNQVDESSKKAADSEPNLVKKVHSKHKSHHRKHAKKTVSELKSDFPFSLFDFDEKLMSTIAQEIADFNSLGDSWKKTLLSPRFPVFLYFLKEWIHAIRHLFIKNERPTINWPDVPNYSVFRDTFIDNDLLFSEAKKQIIIWEKTHIVSRSLSITSIFGNIFTQPRSVFTRWDSVSTLFSRLPPHLQIDNFKTEIGDNSRHYFNCWPFLIYDEAKTRLCLTSSIVLSHVVDSTLLSTPVFNSTENVNCWNVLEKLFFAYLSKKIFVIKDFNYNILVDAIETVIATENQRFLCKIVSTLFTFVFILREEAKTEFFEKYLFPRLFCPLFLTWDSDVRAGFCLFIVFRIIHPVSEIINPPTHFKTKNLISSHQMKTASDQEDIKLNLSIYFSFDFLLQKLRKREGLEITQTRYVESAFEILDNIKSQYPTASASYPRFEGLLEFYIMSAVSMKQTPTWKE